MGVKIQLFEVGRCRSDFCPCGWMKSKVYKEKVNTRDELVARIMNSAALIKQECPSFILFVRLFMCNIQTAVSPHPLKTGHVFI